MSLRNKYNHFASATSAQNQLIKSGAGLLEHIVIGGLSSGTPIVELRDGLTVAAPLIASFRCDQITGSQLITAQFSTGLFVSFSGTVTRLTIVWSES
jgi:aspartate ammonia-lyase